MLRQHLQEGKFPVIFGGRNSCCRKPNLHTRKRTWTPRIPVVERKFQTVIFSVPLLVFGSVISSTVITCCRQLYFSVKKPSQSLARPSQNCPWMPWQQQSSVYWCIISVDYMPGRRNPNGNWTMKKKRCECGTVDGSEIRRSPVGR